MRRWWRGRLLAPAQGMVADSPQGRWPEVFGVDECLIFGRLFMEVEEADRGLWADSPARRRRDAPTSRLRSMNRKFLLLFYRVGDDKINVLVVFFHEVFFAAEAFEGLGVGAEGADEVFVLLDFVGVVFFSAAAGRWVLCVPETGSGYYRCRKNLPTPQIVRLPVCNSFLGFSRWRQVFVLSCNKDNDSWWKLYAGA